MRSYNRLTALVVALATLVFAFGAGTAAAAPSGHTKTSGSVTAPVTGRLDDGRTFAGSLNVTRFVRSSHGILAVGTVCGTLSGAAGSPTTAVPATPVQVPVDLRETRKAAQGGGAARAAAAAAPAAGCEILDLVLGPLDLNLLGLVVHLDVVHLNITAVPGAGNLLGNLLCAVAGLLDGPSPLNALIGSLTALLNQILGALG